MIIARAPLRISFAGGGTDFQEYYRRDFGAVCSMAINKYVYVSLNNLSDYFPHRYRIAYSKTELVNEVRDIQHPIVRAALEQLMHPGGIDINVMADVPAGTGLGSSSSFTVALVHVLSASRNQLISKEKAAKQASWLETEILKEPIGKQDHYAAAFGGLNLVSFFADEQVRVDPLPLADERKQKLMNRLKLYYLGGNREASAILKAQASNISNRLPVLDEMRAQAEQAAKILVGDAPLDDFGALLRSGWELKKRLTQGVSNSFVDEVMERALQCGALGGKLLGAGGTGFVLLYVPEEKQAQVKKAMLNFHEIDFQIDTMGTTLLYYGE